MKSVVIPSHGRPARRGPPPPVARRATSFTSRGREAQLRRFSRPAARGCAAIQFVSFRSSFRPRVKHRQEPSRVFNQLFRKVKRIPADIADAIREAVQKHNEEGLARAQHELAVAKAANAVMAARLSEIDADFYGPEIARLRRPLPGDRGGDDLPR
jgi:hypothetical protein